MLLEIYKWKKIMFKVEKMKSKFKLSSINLHKITPTKLKRGIGKRALYKDILLRRKYQF